MTTPLPLGDIADLYRDYRAPIYQYVAGKVGKLGTSEELVEDLTSEVFLKAIEAMCSEHGPNINVSGWLFRIARNLIIDHYRRRDRQLPTVDWDEAWGHAAHELSPHEQVTSAIGCKAIWRAVGQLNDAQATVVTLHAEGCDLGEIGAAVGKSNMATKGVLHRSRARLKQLLEARDW